MCPPRDTSLAARRAAEDSGAITAGCRRIMVWFHAQPSGADYTRAEIAKATGMPLQTVCARIRDILDDERPFLEELSARACRVTGNPSHPLRVPKPKAAAQAKTGSATAAEARRDIRPERAGSASSQSSGAQVSEPAPAAPDEQLIHSWGHDKEGKEYPLFYTAVGWGVGWPKDQDHLHKGKA